MINDLILMIFTRRHQAHLAHWASKSFSEHMALGDFYDAITDKLDEFVENYQAYEGLIDKITITEFETSPNILKLLKDDIRWINKNRGKIAKDIPSLENILDDLTSVYTRTVYKLENLK